MDEEINKLCEKVMNVKEMDKLCEKAYGDYLKLLETNDEINEIKANDENICKVQEYIDKYKSIVYGRYIFPERTYGNSLMKMVRLMDIATQIYYGSCAHLKICGRDLKFSIKEDYSVKERLEIILDNLNVLEKSGDIKCKKCIENHLIYNCCLGCCNLNIEIDDDDDEMILKK
jgi:hypothetical protein